MARGKLFIVYDSSLLKYCKKGVLIIHFYFFTWLTSNVVMQGIFKINWFSANINFKYSMEPLLSQEYFNPKRIFLNLKIVRKFYGDISLE